MQSILKMSLFKSDYAKIENVRWRLIEINLEEKKKEPQ